MRLVIVDMLERGATRGRCANQIEQLRPVLVLAELHRKLLDRIAARNYDVATERVELGPLQKPWTAWRAARRAK